MKHNEFGVGGGPWDFYSPSHSCFLSCTIFPAKILSLALNVSQPFAGVSGDGKLCNYCQRVLRFKYVHQTQKNKSDTYMRCDNFLDFRLTLAIAYEMQNFQTLEKYILE